MSDGCPLFSVIIPVYKVEKYLPQCVESVIHQSFAQPFEIILVDDGSPDGCPAMCDEYAAGDKRITVIHKTNGGLSDARNAGMDIATGEYIVFLDSDDYLWQTALQSIADVVTTSNNPDVVILQAYRCYVETGALLNERPYKYETKKLTAMDAADLYMYLVCSTDIVITAWLLVTRRSFLLKNNLNFVKGLLHEDEHWVPLVMLTAKTFGFCNDITYIWRQGRPDSIMATPNIKRSFDKIWIIDDLIRHASKPAFTQKQSEVLRYRCYVLLRIVIKEYYSYLNSPRAEELREMISARFSILFFSKDNKISSMRRYLKFKVFGLNFLGRVYLLRKYFKEMYKTAITPPNKL